MFLHMSVILFTRGGDVDRHPLGRCPTSRPPGRHPLGRPTLDIHPAGIRHSPEADTPYKQTPPPWVDNPG